MSVLVEFSMFPTDKGESVSPYVSRILQMFQQGNVLYKLTPMGTVFETATMTEALTVIEKAYSILEPDCNRIYSIVKFDIRPGQVNRMEAKVASIENKIGEVKK